MFPKMHQAFICVVCLVIKALRVAHLFKASGMTVFGLQIPQWAYAVWVTMKNCALHFQYG